MATDPVLRMLGLARRAGKLAFGDELVREACFDHKVRCVFIAGDAGASTAKKAAFYAERANVPFVTLPHGKAEMGAAIGKAGCAIIAVTDIGLAASAVEKLASEHPEYAEVSAELSKKNERIQSRRGVKKHKEKTEAPAEKPAKQERPAAKRPARKPEGEKRPYRKPDGEQRPFRKDGDRPARPTRKPDGEYRPFRKEGDRPARPYCKPDSEYRPFRKDGDRPARPYRKPDGEYRPFRKDGDRPTRPYRKPDGEQRPFRKDGDRPARPFQKSGPRKPNFPGAKRNFRNKT